jgi:hypothetical protein
MPSGKVRVLVFFVFFLALVVFAVIYRPTHALSRPTDPSQLRSVEHKPAQIRTPAKTGR